MLFPADRTEPYDDQDRLRVLLEVHRHAGCARVPHGDKLGKLKSLERERLIAS